MARSKGFSDEFEDIDFGTKRRPDPVQDVAVPGPEDWDEDENAECAADVKVALPEHGREAEDGSADEPVPKARPIETDQRARIEQAAKQLSEIELPDAADYVEKKPIKKAHDKHFIAGLWFQPEDSEANKNTTIAAAVASLEEIAPRDAIERMLAQQMIVCHSAALECFRRAAIPSQVFPGWDKSLAHAAKLMAAFAKHQGALNKHRGKGQQKVTVEHVHVYSGGQAVVGQVETGAKPVSADKQSAIEYSPEVPLGSQKSKARANLGKED